MGASPQSASGESRRSAAAARLREFIGGGNESLLADLRSVMEAAEDERRSSASSEPPVGVAMTEEPSACRRRHVTNFASDEVAWRLVLRFAGALETGCCLRVSRPVRQAATSRELWAPRCQKLGLAYNTSCSPSATTTELVELDRVFATRRNQTSRAVEAGKRRFKELEVELGHDMYDTQLSQELEDDDDAWWERSRLHLELLTLGDALGVNTYIEPPKSRSSELELLYYDDDNVYVNMRFLPGDRVRVVGLTDSRRLENVLAFSSKRIKQQPLKLQYYVGTVLRICDDEYLIQRPPQPEPHEAYTALMRRRVYEVRIGSIRPAFSPPSTTATTTATNNNNWEDEDEESDEEEEDELLLAPHWIVKAPAYSISASFHNLSAALTACMEIQDASRDPFVGANNYRTWTRLDPLKTGALLTNAGTGTTPDPLFPLKHHAFHADLPVWYVASDPKRPLSYDTMMIIPCDLDGDFDFPCHHAAQDCACYNYTYPHMTRLK